MLLRSHAFDLSRAVAGPTAKGGKHGFGPLLGASEAALSAAEVTPAALDKSAQYSSLAPDGTPSPWSDEELLAWAAASPTQLLRLRETREVGAKAEWPATVVLHAADDSTVPVSSARAFVAALESVLGGAAKPSPTDGPSLVCYQEYEKAGHGEIMLALMSGKSMEELPAIAADFVRECGEA